MSQISPRSAEHRTFAVHPAIIKTLINEQAGSVTKAFAELVMNSIDAEATRIELTIDHTGAFILLDNGRGFQTREEIEQLFETFGTPHQEGDAQFGRFRIGRGQIMAYASTVWRSGHFEMHVDLKGAEHSFEYVLREHVERAFGCCVTGKLYESWNGINQLLGGADKFRPEYSHLTKMLRYVSVPVIVNGTQINTLPADADWELEDRFAFYKFDREARELSLYNQGVFVCTVDARDLGIGGVATTKLPLKVNLARNSVVELNCDTWFGVRRSIRDRFNLQLSRAKKLTENEAVALLENLLFTNRGLESFQKAQSLRFIPDVFDDLRSPNEMLTGNCFTLFDGLHMGIAERVQNEGLATVIMPKLMRQAKADLNEESMLDLVQRLRERLHISTKVPTLVPFADYVRDLNDTSTTVHDSELDPEELVVLKALRYVNGEVALMTTKERNKTRKLIVGLADCTEAWTDGSSYIAIHRKQLKSMRGKVQGGSPARLIALLVHEYSHGIASVGDHDHDRAFYFAFHEAIFRPAFGVLVDKLFRRYIAGIAKLQIVPSGEHRAHIDGLIKQESKLKRKYVRQPVVRPHQVKTVWQSMPPNQENHSDSLTDDDKII